jgi:hypothetical protein
VDLHLALPDEENGIAFGALPKDIARRRHGIMCDAKYSAESFTPEGVLF